MDAKELLAELRSEHREQGQINTAERALEQGEQAPSAQYLGANGEGEAVVQFPTGELVSGEPIFNTMAQPGDLVALHGGDGVPFVDQVSAWEEELEPETVEDFGKIKILYRMPDGGLFIGGDRRVGRRIGSWISGASYQLANTGDGDKSWVASYTYNQTRDAGGVTVTDIVVGWVGGRTVTIRDNAPTNYPRSSSVDGGVVTMPFVFQVGGGWVLVQPVSHFGGLNAAINTGVESRPLFNVSSDLEVVQTGTQSGSDTRTEEGENDRRVLTGSATDAFSSFLLNKGSTQSNAGSYSYDSTENVLDYPSASEDENLLTVIQVTENRDSPRWTQPTAKKSTTKTDSVNTTQRFNTDEPSENSFTGTESSSELTVGTILLGARSGGYWSEVLYSEDVVKAGPFGNQGSTTITDTSKLFFNGVQVDGTLPTGFKRTIAENKLFAFTLTGIELTTGGQAQVNFGRPSSPWRLGALKTSFFKIPADATVIDYSYHP